MIGLSLFHVQVRVARTSIWEEIRWLAGWWIAAGRAHTCTNRVHASAHVPIYSRTHMSRTRTGPAKSKAAQSYHITGY